MNVWHDAYFNQGTCGEMDFDDGFTERAMTWQLKNVIDSASLKDVVKKHKYKPLQWVRTDDGYDVKVSPTEAQHILNAIELIPVQKRLNALRKIQSSDGLCKVLETIKNS